MIGIKSLMVPSTRLAHEQGVGVGDLAQIEVVGAPLATMRVADFRLPSGPDLFFRAPGLLRFLQGRLVAKPVVVDERCKGCWVCVEHCPAEALSKNGRRPEFDYGKCICCYCCQELCPNDAVELRQPLLARVLRGRR
jgi:ferredoxin